MVAAGNCSSCMMTSGAVVRSTRAITLSGICAAGVADACAGVVVLRARHRHRLRRGGRRHIELRQRRRIALIFRLRLENDAVLVGLAVDRRNLPLPEGVVERVVDDLHRDAEPAGLLAIDLDHRAQAAFLHLGGDVAQQRRRLAGASASRSVQASDLVRVGAGRACTDTARG